MRHEPSPSILDDVYRRSAAAIDESERLTAESRRLGQLRGPIQARVDAALASLDEAKARGSPSDVRAARAHLHAVVESARRELADLGNRFEALHARQAMVAADLEHAEQQLMGGRSPAWMRALVRWSMLFIVGVVLAEAAGIPALDAIVRFFR